MVFRSQNNVPDVYVEESRDFQLFLRLMDSLYGTVKYQVSSIRDISNASNIQARLLPLLQTSLGYFCNDFSLSDYELRQILISFPEIMKNKGSRKSIEECIWLFLKLNGLRTTVLLNITNKRNDSGTIKNIYTVSIGIASAIKDISILKSLLSYVIPTGYVLDIYFYTPVAVSSNSSVKDTVGIIYVSDAIQASIRGSDTDIQSEMIDRLLNSIALTEVVGSDCTDEALFKVWPSEDSE